MTTDRLKQLILDVALQKEIVAHAEAAEEAAVAERERAGNKLHALNARLRDEAQECFRRPGAGPYVVIPVDGRHYLIAFCGAVADVLHEITIA